MSSQDLQSAPLMWSAMFAGPCEGVVLPPVSVRQTTVVCCNKSHSCPAKQLFIKRRGYLKHTHTRTHTTIPPASRQVQRWTEDLPAALLSLLPRFNMGSLGVLLFLAVSAVTVKGKLSARALIANWLPRLDRRVWLGRRGISCVWSISRTVCGSLVQLRIDVEVDWQTCCAKSRLFVYTLAIKSWFESPVTSLVYVHVN